MLSELVALRATARRISAGDNTCVVFEWIRQFEGRSTPLLVFESESAVRMVRKYPANWRDMSDDAIYALGWRW